MPAYTSNPVTGDFFAGASWVGGVAPDPNGIDTTTLANGAVLTVATGITGNLGDPANPTVAAVRTAGVGGTGRLICNGTLRVAANVLQGNAHWEFNGAGVKLESTNTTTALVYTFSDAGNQADCLLTVAGTGIGASRAVIRNGVGSAGFRIAVGASSARANISFARFFDLGTTTAAGFGMRSNFASVNSVTDTVFDSCGLVQFFAGTAANTLFNIQRVLVVNGKPNAQFRTVSIEMANTTLTGTRVVEDLCVTNGFTQIAVSSSAAWMPTFTRCYFGARTDKSGTAPIHLVDCIVRQTSANGGGGIVIGGSITRGFQVSCNTTPATNWHGLSVSNTLVATTVDGIIVDGAVGDANGDLFFVNRQNAATQTTFRNVLCTVSNLASGAYGKMVNTSGALALSADPAIPLTENCTWITTSGEAGFLRSGETDPTYPGIFGTFRNNLAWGRSANTGQTIGRENPGAGNNIKDFIDAANVTNNAVVNPYNDGVNGDGHYTLGGGDGQMWTGTVPTYTTVGDPNMVDESRNLATWYRSVVGGTPDTRTLDTRAALDAIASQWGDAPVTGATIPNAWTWIREGYRPQNAALNTGVSSNNGGWQGAVEGVAGGLSAGARRQYRTNILRMVA
jgi:hypothetical protein